MLKKKFSPRNRSNSAIVADDDVDDETFLKNARAPRSSIATPYSKSPDFSGTHDSPSKSQRGETWEDQKSQLISRRKEIEQRTLESTARSLSLLRDSEEVGIATAEELVRQGEQLEVTNERLDEINESLHYSGKHIQGISSIFGSLKNYWSNRKSSSDKDREPKSSKSPRSVSLDNTPRSRRQLQNALDRANTNVSTEEHPALRIRGISSSSQGKTSTESSDDVHELLDRNLDEMAGSLARLKGLAEGLGQELESQNHLLDDVIGKTEKADMSIERQNKDINRILRK